MKSNFQTAFPNKINHWVCGAQKNVTDQSAILDLPSDPEIMERMHMNVWYQRWTANHNTESVWLTSRERAREIQNSFDKG